MARPRVSVVINTYNRGHRIPATLEGLDRQTYREFEVVVVNGPSTDRTEQVLRRYGDRIRVGSCPVANLGVSRNIGIDMAAGDIVAFIDDDAVPRDAWLERLVDGYDEPSVAGVGGYVFDGVNDRMQWKLCTSTRLGEGEVEAAGPVERYLGRGADPFMYLPGCNMSFRRSVLVEIGGFDGRYVYGYEDTDICCRIIDDGYRLAVRADAIVDHFSAANRARTETGEPRDPYEALHAQFVFGLQHGRDRYSPSQIAAVVQREAAYYRAMGGNLLDRGVLSRGEWALYQSRIETGVRDGGAAAAGPALRQFEVIRESAFRPYLRSEE